MIQNVAKFSCERRQNGIYVPKELETSSRVFMRIDLLRRALQPPYLSPHEVISRGEKTYKIEIDGKPTAVSLDRLKPAFFAPYKELTTTVKPASAVDVEAPKSEISVKSELNKKVSFNC